MTELIEKLRAALDDDERVAQASIGRNGRAEHGRGNWTHLDDGRVEDDQDILRVRFTWRAEGAHIARHDPARVLRQVAAMRKVLELHSPVDVVAFGKVTARECAACFDVDTYRGYSEEPPRLDWPCPTILAFAEAYGIEAEG